jgi:hypothetical protein
MYMFSLTVNKTISNIDKWKKGILFVCIMDVIAASYR